LHFPTPFERDYLVDHFSDGKPAQLTLNDDGSLQINAGEYSDRYEIESKFEAKYVQDYFRVSQEAPKSDRSDDNKLDLDNEDELNENPFK